MLIISPISFGQAIENNTWERCDYYLGGEFVDCKINIRVTDKYITTNIDGVFTEYDLTSVKDCSNITMTASFQGIAVDGSGITISYRWYRQDKDSTGFQHSDEAYIDIKSARGNLIVQYHCLNDRRP